MFPETHIFHSLYAAVSFDADVDKLTRLYVRLHVHRVQ